MKQKIRQLLAIFAILIILGLVFTSLIFSITGNPDFWGIFGLCLTLPVLLFIILIIVRIFH